MDKPDPKIHKLAASAERPLPADARQPESREETPALRYVAIPDYDGRPYADEDSIDLLALWRVLANYRGVVLGAFVLGMLLACGLAFLSIPIYRAELVMAPTVEEKGSGLSALAGQFGGLASLAGVNLPSGGKDVDKVLATLKSRAFLVPFLEQEKILPILAQETNGEAASRLDAYKAFAENMLDVRNDNKTGLVTLAVEWRDPTLAARWANALVARLNEHQRQTAIREAQQSIDYLNQQLNQTSVVDMQQAIYRLIESQTKIIMLANVKKEYAMQVIDPALAPEEPRWPQRILIFILAAILSVFAGIFAAFLLHGLKNFKQQLAQAD